MWAPPRTTGSSSVDPFPRRNPDTQSAATARNRVPTTGTDTWAHPQWHVDAAPSSRVIHTTPESRLITY